MIFSFYLIQHKTTELKAVNTIHSVSNNTFVYIHIAQCDLKMYDNIVF